MTSSVPESPEEARWRVAALGGPKPRAYEDLVATGADGTPIQPLYLPRHLLGLEARGEPGVLPFVRGAAGPWVVAQRYEVADVDRTLDAIREDRAAGVDAAWLEARGPLSEATQAALADGLRATGTPVYLDAGEAAVPLAQALAAVELRVHAQFDPLSVIGRSGGLAHGWSEAIGSAARLLLLGGGRALAASAALVHDAGGTAAQEIGFALACVIEMTRALSDVGVPTHRALEGMTILVAPGTDVLAGVAKLRALRLVWAKLCAALEVEVAPHLAGLTSERAQSVLDAPTNMIRGSLETAALILGHADVIATRAFDAPVGEPTRLGRRLAKNTQLVLREEAHLGAVADPAGGSYFVEAHTDALARAGWDEMRAIEREGGARASLLSGAFPGRVEAARKKSDASVATRRRVLVGVNNFVSSTDSPTPTPRESTAGSLAPSRASSAFEAVRARAAELGRKGGRPRAVLLCLGDAKEHRAREEFSRRFFEAGGFEVDKETGPGSDWVSGAVARADAPVVVVCGGDDRYTELGVSVVAAAKAAGARWIVLAGKPGALEAALRAAGLQATVHLGCDAVVALTAALDAVQRPA